MRIAFVLAALLAIATPAAAQIDLVSNDVAALPAPVQATWRQLVEAARAGDFKALEQVRMEKGTGMQLGFGGAETVTDFLVGNSYSGDGVDALARVIEALEAPYAKVDDGEGSFFFIWPYLASVKDLSALTDADRLVAYQLVSPEGLDDFVEYGGWLGIRTIIDADGHWTALVAGD